MRTTVNLIAPDFLGSERAECFGKNDLMYPYRYNATDGPVVKAKKLCDRCPYNRPCLLWALKAGETDGIWGGTTPDERKQLWRP